MAIALSVSVIVLDHFLFNLLESVGLDLTIGDVAERFTHNLDNEVFLLGLHVDIGESLNERLVALDSHSCTSMR